jgi:Protein of unknown function, DUF255
MAKSRALKIPNSYVKASRLPFDSPGTIDGMVNRLAASTSPYLLQHAQNPVDWWEWSLEAFAEARKRDVPIVLSVGYAACHLVSRNLTCPQSLGLVVGAL